MTMELERRRVLFLAPALEATVLQATLAPVLAATGWDLIEADTRERAQFLLRYTPCDVLLVDEEYARREGPEGLAWLAAQRVAPVVLLTDWDEPLITAALERGVQQWLPRGLVLDQPRILIPFLERVACVGDLRGELQRLGKVCVDLRQQVKDLVSQLADLLPLGQRAWWLPTSLLPGRLCEEMERARRHSIPVSLVLGEVRCRFDAPHRTPTGPPLDRWLIRRIDKAKRMSDIAGHWRDNRFLLLLTHTMRSGTVECCRRLKATLEKISDDPAEHQPVVRAALGAVCSPTGRRELPHLLRAAEKCLARAKRGEGAGVVVL